jgi:hypothetical protein
MRYPARLSTAPAALLTLATLATLATLVSPAAAQTRAHDPTRVHPIADLKRDYQLLRNALEEAHPSLSWYTSERELQTAFKVAAQALAVPDGPGMTERQFYNLLAPAVTLIRDGHTTLEMSQEYERWADSHPWTFLPFSLLIDRDRLFVLANRSTEPSIQPGDELVEINGREVPSLLAAARSRISPEGFGETWRDFQLEYGGFKRFLAQNLGLTPPFVLGVVKRNGRNSKVTVSPLTAVDGAPGMVLPAGPPPPRPDQSFRLLDGATALLTINSFRYANHETIHREIFQQLMDRRVEHLIIDLRENNGGNADLAVDLTRYLVDRPFRFFSASWARLRHPEAPSFARHLDPKTTQLLIDHNRYHHREGARYYFENAALGVHQPNCRHGFHGSVYLLTSGRTFSSASLMVASLKALRNVTIIGQETGGGEAGCSGGINQTLTLPTTRLRLRLPLFRLLSASTTPNRGRGVMPDYPIKYGWREKVAGRDLEMEKALELIGTPRVAAASH